MRRTGVLGKCYDQGIGTAGDRLSPSVFECGVQRASCVVVPVAPSRFLCTQIISRRRIFSFETLLRKGQRGEMFGGVGWV